MIRKCAKCGEVKSNADMTATEDCPSCGVVYSKATIAAAQEGQRNRVVERVERKALSGPGFIEMVCWAVTLLGAFLGMAQLIITSFTAESAPQQAAGAALAAASAVVPYCLARAVQIGTRGRS